MTHKAGDSKFLTRESSALGERWIYFAQKAKLSLRDCLRLNLLHLSCATKPNGWGPSRWHRPHKWQKKAVLQTLTCRFLTFINVRVIPLWNDCPRPKSDVERTPTSSWNYVSKVSKTRVWLHRDWRNAFANSFIHWQTQHKWRFRVPLVHLVFTSVWGPA